MVNTISNISGIMTVYVYKTDIKFLKVGKIQLVVPSNGDYEFQTWPRLLFYFTLLKKVGPLLRFVMSLRCGKVNSRKNSPVHISGTKLSVYLNFQLTLKGLPGFLTHSKAMEVQMFSARSSQIIICLHLKRTWFNSASYG